MKTNFFISALLLSVFSLPVLAQNESDALRFSQTYSGGTARSMGLSGAFGALGGDASSLGINPGGIGVYRASEFTITTGVNYDAVNSGYLGNSYEDYKYKLNLSNLAYVYTYNTKKNTGWVSASFGIGYNRLADFNRNISIIGRNATGSLLDEFVNNFNNGLPNDDHFYYEDLAWATDVILKDNNTGQFGSDYTYEGYGQTIEKNIVTKGGIGEFDFSFGANYGHMVYLGATIGVQRVAYEEVNDHSEFDDKKTLEYLKSFSFREHFNAYGTGINFKIGTIIKPIDFLRIGLAVHTPTFYSINSEFYTSMNSSFDQGTPAEMDTTTTLAVSDFTLNTPFKAIGSLAFVFDKYGLFSLDYEFVDYTKARFRSDESNFNNQNTNIRTFYRTTANIRAGLEGRLGPFSARVGYGYYGSPYKDNPDYLNYDYSYHSYSAGLGVRGKSVFFDLAYVLNKSNEEHRLFLNDIATLDIQQSKIMATLGFRF